MNRPFKKTRALAVFLAFALPAGTARASSDALGDARDALATIARKHKASSSFSLSFESRAMGADGNPMPAAKGSLVTGDSGRFRLQHAQGTVVCDGKTIWQYFPSTRQVLIKDASSAGEAGGVLLRFLQARAIKADRLPGGNLRVILDPASVGENLDSLILTVASDPPAVRGVETQDPAGNRVEYSLKSLRFDARPGRGAFEFRVPPGAETVDMR